jgi:hypothetical protein
VYYLGNSTTDDKGSLANSAYVLYTNMEGLNRILDRFTDGENGSLHGAAFMVIDSSGKASTNANHSCY